MEGKCIILEGQGRVVQLHKVCCQKLKGRKLQELESPQKNEIQVARATLTEQPGEPTMRTGNKKSTTINSIMLIQAKQNAAKVKKSFLDLPSTFRTEKEALACVVGVGQQLPGMSVGMPGTVPGIGIIITRENRGSRTNSSSAN